jgi:hypothetical protein
VILMFSMGDLIFYMIEVFILGMIGNILIGISHFKKEQIKKISDRLKEKGAEEKIRTELRAETSEIRISKRVSVEGSSCYKPMSFTFGLGKIRKNIYFPPKGSILLELTEKNNVERHFLLLKGNKVFYAQFFPSEILKKEVKRLGPIWRKDTVNILGFDMQGMMPKEIYQRAKEILGDLL